MLRRIAVLCFFSTTFIGVAGAQPLPPLTYAVRGNTHVSEKELVVYLRSKGLVVFQPGMGGAVQDALRDVYTARGFPLARVDSLSFQPVVDSSSWVCVVTLTEGPLVKLGELSIAGETAIPRADIVRAMALTRDTPFSTGILQEGIMRILALFERRGYPFASVAVRDIAVTAETARNARADVTLEIQDGGLRTIDEITVEGNTSTRTHVIARETRIAPGEIFDAGKVNEIRRSVERLGFFRSVSEPTFYIRGDRGGILLKVVEGNTNTFDGIVGYQPPVALTEKGYLTGVVKLSLRNLFGTGRRFDARWERASRTVTELELHYTEPWLFGYPFTVGGGFFQRQQDSAYVRRAVEGTASYLAGRDWSVSATVRSVAVIPAANTTIAGLASSTTWSAGLTLLIDGRDDMYNPSSGIWVRNAYSGGFKSFVRPGTQEKAKDFIQRIEADIAWYRGLFRNTVLAVSVHGRELRGSELDVSDYYFLGGANTLRGYREEQFAGSRTAWANFEGRYLFAARSNVYAFFDLGYVFLPGDSGKRREEFRVLRNGYGIGVRLETAVGILSVSYALGQGDAVSNGKIHFGIENAF